MQRRYTVEFGTRGMAQKFPKALANHQARPVVAGVLRESGRGGRPCTLCPSFFFGQKHQRSVTTTTSIAYIFSSRRTGRLNCFEHLNKAKSVGFQLCCGVDNPSGRRSLAHIVVPTTSGQDSATRICSGASPVVSRQLRCPSLLLSTRNLATVSRRHINLRRPLPHPLLLSS